MKEGGDEAWIFLSLAWLLTLNDDESRYDACQQYGVSVSRDKSEHEFDCLRP